VKVCVKEVSLLREASASRTRMLTRPSRRRSRPTTSLSSDVRAVSRLDDLAGRGVDVAEEVERLPVVVGVQSLAFDRDHGEHRAADPRSGVRQ
jgi:hypothetical protein